MNISHVSNNKRPAEIVLSGKNKRLKTEVQNRWRAKVSEFIKHPISKKKFKARTPFASLPQEMLAHIFDLLRPCDFVKFEQLCKTHTQLTGDSVWKKLRKENHLDFEFAMCVGMNERDRYFFADGVSRYSLKTSKKPKYVVKKIYPKYAFLMARFPNLKQLILNDLDDRVFDNHEFRQLIFENSLAGWAGENLIQGMIARRKGKMGHALQYFKIALEGNATCAAILSASSDAHLPTNIEKTHKLVCHAADLGDYRAMEYYVANGDFLSSLYDQKRLYPPVLWDHGITLALEKKYDEADPFYEDAIKDYLKQGKPVPPKLLHAAAVNKNNRTNLQEAENLYEWALNFVTSPWLSLLVDTAIVKSALEKWNEAEPLVDQALLKLPEAKLVEKHEDQFYIFGVVKLKVSKFQEAKELFNKEKSTDNPHTDKINLMIMLAQAHIGLEEFDEAKEYLKQALELYDSTKSGYPGYLDEIAYSYILLKDWPEAERVYEQSIKDYSLQSKQVPMVNLINLSHAKERQNKLEESIQPLLQIIERWEDITPPDIHERMAEYYMTQGRRKEAEDHFDKALKIRCEEGSLVPDVVLKKALELKKSDYKRSYKYLKRIIALDETIGCQPSSTCLLDIIEISWQLKRWEDIAKYFPVFIKIVQSEGHEVSYEHLADYAYALEMIGRLDDSIALLKQIEAQLNDKLLAEIRAQMANVYSELKDFEKADEYYEKAFESNGLERIELDPLVVCNAIKAKVALGKIEEAAHYLKRIVAHNESIGMPLRSEFFIKLGAVYLQLKLWPSAEEAYEKALADFHLNGVEEPLEILKSLVYIKRRLEKYKGILKLLKKIVVREDIAYNYEYMATCYAKLNRFDKAEAFFEKAFEMQILARSPISLETVKDTVRSKFSLKKTDIEDYLKKVVSHQESFEVLSIHDFAKFLIELQFWELAEDYCKKALENPQIKNTPLYFYFLGYFAIVKKHQGLVEEAASLLKQLIELPNHRDKIILLDEMSIVFENLGYLNEVEICLEEVIKIAPALGRQPRILALEKLFHVKSKLGKLEESLEILKQVMARVNHYHCFLNASFLSHQLNLYEDAMGYLSQAVKFIESMDPSIDKDKALQKLAAYEKCLQNS